MPRWLTAALAAISLCGCAKDTILAAGSCGDGVVDENEACDVKSPGCVQCQAAKGFSCTDNVCASVCGDGNVATDEECDPPDGKTCDATCHLASKPEACDLGGFWITRQTTFSLPRGLPNVQTTSLWHIFHFEQDGATVKNVGSVFCGLQVVGSVRVSLSTGGLRGMLYWNPQFKTDPKFGGRARTGTFQANSSGGCDLALERHWFIRGGAASLLPTDYTVDEGDPSLPPLPSVADPTQPCAPGTCQGQHIDEAVDVDGDGVLGLVFEMSGISSAHRNTVQRDWTQIAPDAAFPIAQHALDFTASTAFNSTNGESILAVTDCGQFGCGPITLLSDPKPNAKHRTVFRWLGGSLDDARVKAFLTKDIGEDPDADMTACQAVRDALPLDQSIE